MTNPAPEPTMTVVDGREALAYLIILPNPDGSGVMIDAAANGISKEQGADILRHVANLWKPAEPDPEPTEFLTYEAMEAERDRLAAELAEAAELGKRMNVQLSNALHDRDEARRERDEASSYLHIADEARAAMTRQLTPVVEAAKYAVRDMRNTFGERAHASDWLTPVARRLIAAVDALNGTRTPPEPGDLREQLAAIEHARWADWQRYMHGLCDRGDDGSLTIPANLVTRWEQQIAMPYAELSEKEKDSDREQVDRYWHLIVGGV